MSGTTVNLFRSTDTGAPTLNGTAGSLISVLDACLQDGYNSKSVQSITRSGSTATATFATAHGYAADGATKVRISGASQTEYNGDFVISNVTTTSFDFTVTGTPATPATGTITAKVAPLGWSKAFSGTNKAAYRSNEATGTRLYLHVDDNNEANQTNRTAIIRGFESMTGPETTDGVNYWAGQYVCKSDSSNSTNVNWVVCGDGFEFFIFWCSLVSWSAPYNRRHQTAHFGDFLSFKEGDLFNCALAGDASATNFNAWPGGYSAHRLISTSGLAGGNGADWAVAREYTAVVGSVTYHPSGARTSGDLYPGKGPIPYPTSASSALHIAPVYLSNANGFRGQLKGIWDPMHLTPLGNLTLLPANQSPIGRRLFSLEIEAGSAAGELHLDIDGPWR